MVMIDDATNRTYAQFAEGETTRAAYDTFEGYVRRYGLPLEPLTQFGRAMDAWV